MAAVLYSLYMYLFMLALSWLVDRTDKSMKRKDKNKYM